MHYAFAPGSMLRARRNMKSWHSDNIRDGEDSRWIIKGELGLVVQVWGVGNQIRMRLMTDRGLTVTSSPAYTVTLNWEAVESEPSGALGNG